MNLNLVFYSSFGKTANFLQQKKLLFCFASTRLDENENDDKILEEYSKNNAH